MDSYSKTIQTIVMYICATSVVSISLKGERCIIQGGACVQSRAYCTGWIDSYDISCANSACCKPIPSTHIPEPPHPNNDTCGQITRTATATSNPRFRIVGGNAAVEGQWPWQVGLIDMSGDIFCGGTLISPEFVVSAAHCFISYTEADVKVVLGEHHLEYNTGNEVQRGVKIIVKHSGYSPSSNADDIAFLQLDAPVDISGHYIRTVCLPSQDQVWNANDNCYVSGWGYTKSMNSDDRHLQHLNVNLVSNSDCSAAWNIHANITNNQICAGTGGTGTCKGDSGGPMVCVRDNSYYLVGVTSFGHYTCMQDGFPDVYTSVAKYRDWLTSYMLLLKVSVR